MNIDMHCHMQVYKRQFFSEERLIKIARAAKENNVDALVALEHYNSKQVPKILELIQKEGIKAGDAFLLEETLFFPGLEVNIKGKGHIVVMGTIDKIIALRNSYPKVIKKSDSLSLKALLKVCQKYGLRCTGAHPYRVSNYLYNRKEEVLKKLNYIELNGRNIDTKEQTYELAKKLGLRVVSGSDTHHLAQMGGIYMKLQKRVNTYNELFEQIDAGNYNIQISKNIDLKNKTGIEKKKIVKEYELNQKK